MSRTEQSPETNTYMITSYTTKVENSYHEGRMVLLNKWCWDSWKPIRENLYLKPYSTLLTKINSVRFDLKVKGETKKILEESKEHLYDLRVNKDFLNKIRRL